MKKLLLLFALFASSIVAAQLPNGIITGQVLSREGQPASGIRVSAMAVPEAGGQGTQPGGGTALVGLALTDSAGRYRLENVPPGRYYIVAGLVDSPTYYPGTSSVGGATALNVLSGRPITEINFTMAVSAGVTVSGRLVHPNGTPATEVPRVGLAGPPGPIQDTAVRSDGTFQFLKVRPGNYTLMLGGVPSSQPTPIVVGDNDVTAIEVQVLPTVTLAGTVEVEGDGLRPRIGIMFSPFRGGGNIPSASLQANGSFRVTVPEGEYRVGWTGLPAGYELKSITSDSVDLLSTTLKASPGSPIPLIVVKLGVGEKPPWVKVAGRVRGLPAVQTGPPYRLNLSGGVLDAQDIPINPDGSFEFARLLPGSYTARITPALPVGATPITVGNRDIADLSITIPPMKEIRGLASMPSAASLALRFSLSEPVGGAATASTAIQRDGTFSIVLPEGERRITAQVPGYTVQALTYGSTDLLRNPIKVSSSDSLELRMTLAPAGGVVGGVPGGVLGGIITPLINATAGIAPPPPPAKVISAPPPAYPELAKAARVQGVVQLQARISREGLVEDLVLISGHPLLNDAAIQAVRQWRYEPVMVNGQTVPVITTVTVNFTLP